MTVLFSVFYLHFLEKLLLLCVYGCMHNIVHMQWSEDNSVALFLSFCLYVGFRHEAVRFPQKFPLSAESFMCLLLLVFLTLFSLTPLPSNVVTYSDKKQLKGGKGRFSLQLQVTIHHLRQGRETCLIFHTPLLPTKEFISSPKKYSWNHGGCCLLGGLYTLSYLS